eukprot:701006-Amphidinium_carterae.1
MHQPGVEPVGGLYDAATLLVFIGTINNLRGSRTGRTPADNKVRNVAGVSTGKTASIAIAFTFELLDIFIGSFAATFLPEMDERRLMPHPDVEAGYPGAFMQEQRRRDLFQAPEGCFHLKCVLCLGNFQVDASSDDFKPDVNKLVQLIVTDLTLRGLDSDRIETFKARVHSRTLLLQGVRRGYTIRSNVVDLRTHL